MRVVFVLIVRQSAGLIANIKPALNIAGFICLGNIRNWLQTSSRKIDLNSAVF